MASPENSKTSSEQVPVKPLHGHASNQLRQNERHIIAAINACNWSEPGRGSPGLDRLPRAIKAQTKAKARRLEQSRATPPAVKARKPSETRSRFRMTHPPTLMLDRID
jgi:hypothetical protein